MSATLHVLLEAEPCLEGDVADGKADHPACQELGQVTFMLYLEGRQAPWTINMSLDRLEFLEKFLPQWLHWADKQGRTTSDG